MAHGMTPETRVLVAGASGYVGGRLVPRLLDAGYRVRAMARSAARLRVRPWASHPAAEVVEADVLDRAALQAAAAGCSAVYDLVRSVDLRSGPSAPAGQQGAANMAAACAAAGVRRIIALAGLGETRPEADILGRGSVPVTVLRPAMIIGSGNASFEILRHLVDRHPLMIVPRWINTLLQPIAIRNVLGYLIGCLEHDETIGEAYDIGGPEVLTCRQLMGVYADEAGLPRPRVVTLPILTPGLSSYWIHLVTPIPWKLARPFVAGLRHPLLCHDERIRAIIPQELLSTHEAIRLALERMRRLEVESSWGDATRMSPAEWLGPDDPAWAGGTAYVDRRHIVVEATPEQVWRSLSRVGGRTGWYYGDALWRTRAVLDRVLGGVGLGHGRRDPAQLAVGDSVDLWRVAALDAPRRLVLVAAMRVPGRAWLEFRIGRRADGHTELVQEATFHPRGLSGMLYWYAVYPFHQLLFGGMLRGIAQAVGTRVVIGPARLGRNSVPES